MDKWYENRDNLSTLLYLLKEHSVIVDIDEAVYFIEKPWKWENYWDAIEELVNDNNNNKNEERISQAIEQVFQNE